MSHWHPRHWKLGVASVDEAVFYQCLTAVRSRIRALALSGIADASIVAKKLPLPRAFRDTGGIALPAIIITPHRDRIDTAAGTNARDEITYHVLVTIFAADNQEATLAASLDTYLKWRQRIHTAFRNQRLTGVSSIVNCRVESYDVLHGPSWMDNLFVSGLILQFISRETRG